MRRQIAHIGISQLKYEIREIVAVAKHLEKLGQSIRWENIGDPINKGERLPEWMKQKIASLSLDDRSYGYVETKGIPQTRAFLAELTNRRGGVQITEEDIIFFNGLGDAVARIFGNLKRESRVIGPSPAYSTHSSAEAAHSGYDHVSYKLDPEKDWMPDLEELENKVRYNDSISGILVINPDNPTGAVYPRHVLEEIVRIAKANRVFLLFDEIYTNVVFNGAESVRLSDVIDGVPGLSLKGISKEYPWPGSRCGWVEVYNQHENEEFSMYVRSLINAKMLEVCSTSLPQLSIPVIMGDERYAEHLENRAHLFEQRTNEAYRFFKDIDGIKVIKPQGGFYMTILFEEGQLNDMQYLAIASEPVREYVEQLVKGVAPDKRFVYYLLGARGICVVPLTGFYSDLQGFRLTMLETDDEIRQRTWEDIGGAIGLYLGS